ncbi:MAG: YbhN family protein [Acidimicrobiales bacterium]
MGEHLSWRRRLGRAWPWLRYVLGLGLAALALWALSGRRGELSGATRYLSHIDWVWLLLGVGAEVASLVAFGLVQQRLLEAGRVRMSLGRVTAVTFAVTAIANSMPAGPLVSSVFAFHQYRRQGADEAFAGWTLAAVFVAASVSLAVVAAAGLAIAGAEGAGFNLVWVTVGVLAAAVLLGALFVQQRAVSWMASSSVRASRRMFHWPSEEAVVRVEALIERLSLVHLTVGEVLSVTGWAVANWVLDCSCLALSFMAVGVGIPWKGLLLAYGAGQLAANLPITPGGLGVVEGSLTIALVAFGGAETQTVAAVLLYRIISFWGELPVGWATWGAIIWGHRGSRAGAVDARIDADVAKVTV